ncbi:HGxxPAAW family protein [Streptomyces sp. NPDC020983]|uniref:HGxxPAAW family protein n=1 Tax=Streptomyces sp. NPDC020983 TaxID=3365106 RepID=UPI00379DA3CF
MAAHYDHGHTPAAWTGVIISFVGFCAAGVFIVAADPVPFWISMGVVLLGPLVGGIMKSMGMGRTSQVTVPAAVTEREKAAAGA